MIYNLLQSITIQLQPTKIYYNDDYNPITIIYNSLQPNYNQLQ